MLFCVFVNRDFYRLRNLKVSTSVSASLAAVLVTELVGYGAAGVVNNAVALAAP